VQTLKTLYNFSIKQVYRNIKKCCISLYRLGNQYIFVRLQIKYLSIAGLNLDEIGDFVRTKNDILDNIFQIISSVPMHQSRDDDDDDDADDDEF